MPPVDNSKGIVKKKPKDHPCLHADCVARKPFTRPCYLKEHIDKTHLGINHFVCDYIIDEKNGKTCGQVCSTKGNLTTHERTHSDLYVTRTYKEHWCTHPGCKRAPFTCTSHLQQHMDFAHRGIRHFECDHIMDEEKGTKCGKAFPTHGKLENHKKERHSEVAEYKCTHTGCEWRKSFGDNIHLQAHIDFFHLGILNFVCDYIVDDEHGTTCGHACERRNNLDAHKRSHSDVRDHECSEPSCGAKFKFDHVRHLHWVRRHSPPNDPARTKHKCTSCTAAFSGTGDLEEHRLYNHVAKDDPMRLAYLDRKSAAKRAQYANDENHRIACRVRAGLCRVLNNMGLSKECASQVLLGCSYEELVIHLNNNSRGFIYGDETMDFHIDHIRPLASFNKRCRIELLKSCNWNNLQLLPGPENLGKGGKFPPSDAAAYAASDGGIAIAVLEVKWRGSKVCGCGCGV
jgi:hypothetical protein